MKTKRIVMLLLVAVLLLSSESSFVMSSLITSQAISSYGLIDNFSTQPLHVVGNRILNNDGSVIYLRGVDYSYFIDGPYGSWRLPNGQIEWNTWDLNAIASNLDAIKSWGGNCIRVLATSQWWVSNTGNFRNNLETFISMASERGIYVEFTFWRNNDTQTQPAIPYPPYDIGNNVINSVSDFVNMWASVATSLKGYPNVLFEFWNEPHGDAIAEASWFDVTQQCITAIRNTGSTNLIVSQWGFGVGLDFDNSGSSIWTMDWVNNYPLADSSGNLIYSTHIYRNMFYHCNSGTFVYSLDDMISALNRTIFSVVTDKPVFIGEIGCSNWHNDQANELTWFTNTLSLLNQHNLGYCDWAWAPWDSGTEWGLMVSGQPNYAPNQAGQILQQQIASSNP
jgi:hypothetical protein